MIASGAVTSSEVIEAHLARIEEVNPELNAVTATLADEAREAAVAVDRSVAAGEQVGALAGVPFTVKENIDLACSATTWGVVAFAEQLAPTDAPTVARLREAGAIPLARTNLPDFAFRWHTESGRAGHTRNPWDTNRTPGGSSGGEAVALATGMTPLGVGNDFGGSLRVPSQMCGTAALRPSRGRVADAGVTWPLMEPIAGTGLMEFIDACFARGVGKPVDQAAQLAAWEAAHTIGAAWTGFLQEHPIVLSPVCCERPWIVGEDIDRVDEIAGAMRMVVPVNVLGLPACAVPVGSDEGLPQGVQLIGGRFREDLILAAAQAIEDRAPVLTPISPRVTVAA